MGTRSMDVIAFPCQRRSLSRFTRMRSGAGIGMVRAVATSAPKDLVRPVGSCTTWVWRAFPSLVLTPPVLHKNPGGAGGAVGFLRAVLLLVTIGLLHAALRPVRFHLVGDDHGHRGADALPHLRAMADDRHDAVLTHAHVHVWQPRLGPRGQRVPGIVQPAKAERTGGDHQATHAQPLDEGATLRLQGGIALQTEVARAHDRLPAATLMAARMRL